MSILRTDKIAGLDSVNAITGSVKFSSGNGANQGTYLELYDPDGTIKFGTGEFSIEFWMYANTIDTSGQENDLACILDYGYGSSGNTAGAHFALHQEDRTLHFGFNNANQVQSSNFLNANTWHHIAIQRQGGNTKIYGDGTQVGTVADTQDYTDALFRTLQIGSQAASGVERNFDGYISTLRICKGHAVYNGAFTPPTRALEVHPGPDDDRTVVFCCHSSQDAYREETGKTIVLGTLSKTPGPLASTFVPDVGNDHTHGTVLEGGTAFSSLNYMTLPRGITTQSNRGRGLFMGGYAPSQYRTEIDYIQIQSQGNAIDFGVLSGTTLGEGADCASSTRAIQGGGSLVNTMEYVTIATTSNTTNFGDLTVARRSLGSLSSETRGIWAGGTTNPAMSDVIDYVAIATLGDATDFGNLTVGRRNMGTAASPTRGVFAGGNPGSSPLTDDTIDYITIASTGDATDFGNLSGTYREMAGCSNGTRGIFAGGGPGSSSHNIIEFITIATTGNAADFGDLFYAAGNLGGTSNGTRGVFGGGAGAAYTNIIQYITIATTGNAADFGDLTFARILYSATSDSHGGLS